MSPKPATGAPKHSASGSLTELPRRSRSCLRATRFTAPPIVFGQCSKANLSYDSKRPVWPAITAQTRRRDRSGRGRGQEPAGAVPSPAGVAHPHEDDRIVAHLSHPGEVARTRPSRPRGHRGARLGRRLFRGADRAHMARHSPANRTRCLIWAPTCACPTSTSTSLSNGWRISPKLARR